VIPLIASTMPLETATPSNSTYPFAGGHHGRVAAVLRTALPFSIVLGADAESLDELAHR
jgi:hypothetical protein